MLKCRARDVTRAAMFSHGLVVGVGSEHLDGDEHRSSAESLDEEVIAQQFRHARRLAQVNLKHVTTGEPTRPSPRTGEPETRHHR